MEGNIDTTSIYTVIITIITVLGSTTAFKFYERRAYLKRKSISSLQDDCRERIDRLEVLLVKSSLEKEDMRSKILSLTSEVAILNTKVDFLEREKSDIESRYNEANKRK